RTDPPALEAELEDPLERLDLLDDGALVDLRDELGGRATGRGARLRLGKCALARLAADGDRAHPCSSPRIAWSSCSRPPVSTAQWIPHSFGAFSSHHQRPSRPVSPGAIERVQGAQPIDVYPRS